MRNFIVVGGQRCGTTWLYKVLDSHLSIEMAKPVRPEPKYFLNVSDISIKDYLKKYFNGDTSSLLGEKSTSYYESDVVALNIKKHLPETKIIFIVRNPIERAISNYNFSKANGLEVRSLEEVFLYNTPPPEVDILASVNPFDYIKRGMYSVFIKQYIDVFGSENVRVVCFEKIISDSHEFKSLLNFLDVNSDYLPDIYSEKVNETVSKIIIPKKIRDVLLKCYETEVKNMKQYIDTSYWHDFRGNND